MVSKSVRLSMATAFALLYSTQSFAVSGGCNEVEGKVGKVEAVSLGSNDPIGDKMTFKFKYENGEKVIMVVKPIGDSVGHGIFQLLLSAQITQSTFKITRCSYDQLAAGEIQNY